MNRDDKIKLYMEKADQFFPGIRTSSVFSMFGGQQQHPVSGKIELYANVLKDVIAGKGAIQFLHYTSLPSAINILNSGNIRIYNCINMNDPSEIKYLLSRSKLEFDDELLKNYQRQHFMLSGSLYNSEKGEDYNLWRLYGDKGKGVGIVLEIGEHLQNWIHIYLQEVQYGEQSDSSKKMLEFINFHVEFNKQYHLFENIPGFLPLLATGVKNEIWSIENELRIIVHQPFDKYTLQSSDDLMENNLLLSKTLNHEIRPGDQIASYVEMPLHLNDRKSEIVKQPFSNESIDSLDYVPNLKVKKIILGPAADDITSSQFSYFDWLQSKLGYTFEIIKSAIEL